MEGFTVLHELLGQMQHCVVRPSNERNICMMCYMRDVFLHNHYWDNYNCPSWLTFILGP